MAENQLLINNEWLPASNNSSIDIISPWDNQVMDTVPAATTDDANKAVASAKQAFNSWRRTPLSDRITIMRKAIQLMRGNATELAKTLGQEIGKKEDDAASEINRSIDYIELVIEAMIHAKGTVYRGDMFPQYPRGRKTGYYSREPLGVILAISPFNYPINLSITKIAPALIAGNTVVLKPSTQGSISSFAFYKHFVDAGLPAGVLNIISGKASEIGDLLVNHTDVALIAFTGSTEVGKHIGTISRGVPLLMELGGKDIAVVTDKADLDVAVEQIISGAFSYCGQRCTAQKLILVYDAIADEFVMRTKEKAANLNLNPMINNSAADYVFELISDAMTKGANLVLSGDRDGNKVPAHILDHVNQSMRIFHEEQFGPAMPIVRVQDEADALALAAMSHYGLQASVYSKDIEEAFRIADQLEVGTVQINGRSDRGPDNFPFGGTKDSGQFMQGTIETIELMTRGKLTVLNLYHNK